MIAPEKYGYYVAKYGEDYALANSEAEKLEEMKKIVLATLMLRYDGSSASREMNALSSPEYAAHIGRMTEARCKANVARAKFDAVKVDFETWRSLESSRRAEMSIK